MQEMRDDGAQGDAVAGDGYFATLLPPLSSEGDYSVELELRWLDYDHRISSRAAFAAKAYPSLEVRPVLVAGVELDERTKVAEVSVHVQGQPYPVAAEQLTALWNSSSDQEAIIELEPRRLSGDGPAWEYDVYLTANESGHHSVLFNLSVDYAGGPYSYSSESMALSTVPAAAAARARCAKLGAAGAGRTSAGGRAGRASSARARRGVWIPALGASVGGYTTGGHRSRGRIPAHTHPAVRLPLR